MNPSVQDARLGKIINKSCCHVNILAISEMTITFLQTAVILIKISTLGAFERHRGVAVEGGSQLTADEAENQEKLQMYWLICSSQLDL